MATPLSADRLLAALKAEGCRVTEYRDWRTHNRNTKGAWGPVHGVMIHHTVTSGTDSSVRLCYEGHSSLPGPLCHSVGAKDGRIFMVGHGRANHAGSGDDDVLAAVIDETALPPDNEANTDGNARFYGIELINLGDGKDPWPEAQVDAAARWAAALCRAHGWSARSVIGHLEWQPGKIDPRPSTGADVSMAVFRARVKALLAAPAGAAEIPAPQPPQEDDMALSSDDLTKVFNKVWKGDGLKAPVPSTDNPTWMPYSFIRDNNIRLRAVQAQLAAQSAAISELAKALAAHHAEIDADALVAEIKAAIENVTVRLDVEG